MNQEKELEKFLQTVLSSIQPPDEKAMEMVRIRLDKLTKPQGSLGRLEELAVLLAGICGGFFPCNSRKKVIVMAADHGVAEEGVSAYPPEVTAQMVANFAAGKAAINVLARLGGVEVEVADIGVKSDSNLPGVKRVRIKPGSDNFRRSPAMTRSEALQAIIAGVEIAEEAARDGVQVLATGEMGIGNTTASSAVMAALTGYEISLVVGRGTGLDDFKLYHKREVIKDALNLHRPDPLDPIDVLSKVGGLEIAALTGLILGAAKSRIPIVFDGFISSTAALAALKLCPAVRQFMIPSHLSAEMGHVLLMEYMGFAPYLNMGMRLGEGTGAVLAMHLIEAAARIPLEMATFDDAKVSNKIEK